MNRLPVAQGGQETREPNRSFAAAVALSSISTFVAMLAYSGPLGNAPTLAGKLAASSTATTWILSSMSIGLAVSLLTAGAVADLSGRRRVFIAGAVVLAAGSVVCAVASTPLWFIVGRVIEGVGAAGVIATGLGLVAAVTRDSAQGSRSAAWWGASMGLGIAMGPVLTGLFDLADWWQATYWLLAVAGVAIAATARASFVETEVIRGRRLDLVGAALFTVGLTAVLIALVAARQGEIGFALAWGGFAAATLVAFVVSQLRGQAPMVEPALFRRGGFLAATLAAAGAGAGVIALMSFAGTFLAGGMGMTSVQAGMALGLWSATSAFSALFARWLLTKLGGSALLVIGLAATGVGMLLLTGLSATSTVPRLVPGLLVAGVATGILNGGLGRQAVATVPPERAALGTGVTNTARYVGAAIGVTVVSLVAVAPPSDTGAQFAGWNQVAVLCGALSLMAALGVWALARRR
ncbi:MFS transporter [Tamaricihabitans halophyticus]|uniref:MFS transporter n=1 Tax=Tamaricihabitans halophyticus TaxID=1262583 RepID=A0A4R2QH03_9PSEU|nr:MFS transporter [Tamaricihabitans halophyticus]TCP47854.1 MFS transporter [Tamaricihabitans halophyticus]